MRRNDWEKQRHRLAGSPGYPMGTAAIAKVFSFNRQRFYPLENVLSSPESLIGFQIHRSIRPGTNESDASPADASGSFVDPAGT
ncbi:hypothetical protein [Rhodopirellula baltica]